MEIIGLMEPDRVAVPDRDRLELAMLAATDDGHARRSSAMLPLRGVQRVSKARARQTALR